METWKVITDVLNIRTGNSTAYPVKTTAVKGDTLEGVLDTASNWIHISKKNGVVLDGWCSGAPAYVEKVVTPPTPSTNPDVKVTIDLGSAYPVTTTIIKPL